MNILKKENWWIWLLLFLFSEGTSVLVLGAILDVFDKNAWYAKLKYWIIPKHNNIKKRNCLVRYK